MLMLTYGLSRARGSTPRARKSTISHAKTSNTPVIISKHHTFSRRSALISTNKILVLATTFLVTTCTGTRTTSVHNATNFALSSFYVYDTQPTYYQSYHDAPLTEITPGVEQLASNRAKDGNPSRTTAELKSEISKPRHAYAPQRARTSHYSTGRDDEDGGDRNRRRFDRVLPQDSHTYIEMRRDLRDRFRALMRRNLVVFSSMPRSRTGNEGAWNNYIMSILEGHLLRNTKQQSHRECINELLRLFRYFGAHTGTEGNLMIEHMISDLKSVKHECDDIQRERVEQRNEDRENELNERDVERKAENHDNAQQITQGVPIHASTAHNNIAQAPHATQATYINWAAGLNSLLPVQAFGAPAGGSCKYWQLSRPLAPAQPPSLPEVTLLTLTTTTTHSSTQPIASITNNAATSSSSDVPAPSTSNEVMSSPPATPPVSAPSAPSRLAWVPSQNRFVSLQEARRLNLGWGGYVDVTLPAADASSPAKLAWISPARIASHRLRKPCPSILAGEGTLT